MIFEGEVVTSIQHMSGATADLSDKTHVVINRGFVLHDNHSDLLARVVLHPTTRFLRSLFDSAEGFVKELVKDRRGKKLIDIASELNKAEQERSKQAEAAAKIPNEVSSGAQKGRRDAVTQKARAALELKKLQRGEKRKISLLL